MNLPLHICFICDEYPPALHGGTGSSYRDLAEGLTAAGHRVTIVGVYSPERLKLRQPVDETINGVRVVRLPSGPKWLGHRVGTLWNRYKLRRWLAQAHAQSLLDLIEASDYAGWLRFGGPRNVSTIVRIRGSNLFFDTELGRGGDAFEHRLEREALARAKCIAAVSRYAARRTLELCGLSDRECTVIYNAVDTAIFAPVKGVEIEAGLIVFVNSINPRKGIEQLMDAMNVVCGSHSEARLVAIGHDARKGGNQGDYVGKLLERVRPEYRGRVTFTGRLERNTGVLDYLRKAHVCCYPSHMETFGIAAVEAMAVGKPTVFSRTGPGPEIIEDGVSGLLCDPHDPADIASKILRILENLPLAAALGKNARCRVVQMFDKRDWVKRNLEFYENVLARKTESS